MALVEPEIVNLTRDVTAILVPFGSEIFLQKDMEVIITQSLGGTYTVIAAGSMARIANQDADALGKEVINFTERLDQATSLENKIWAQLKTCYDPEIPVNIVDLGLIYGIDIASLESGTSKITVRMTLTAPGCGMGPIIADEVKQKILLLPEVSETEISVIFDPPWDRSRMSDAAKLTLGMF